MKRYLLLMSLFCIFFINFGSDAQTVGLGDSMIPQTFVSSKANTKLIAQNTDTINKKVQSL